MIKINIHEAKTHFSQILNRVSSGEDVVIAKAGKPIARIVPIKGEGKKRKPGSAKGRVMIEDSFFEPLPDTIINDFEQ
ncbi:MAG: type II toxin-antitoxin system Phd/YefM family antitoxin [Candidatus Brocadia sp.]|nr:type II toxin-antitoxin system Phd/YefM family antitoxin [Candidatus Brocadia sp.]